MKNMQKKHRVVIVGGGFGGVEAALYLRSRLGDRVAITLISASDRFVYRPFLTYIPFGLSPASLSLDLDDIARAQDFQLMMGYVDRVDTVRQLVHFGAQSVAYDSLILATGAKRAQGVLPGLRRGFTVWDENEMLRLQGRLARAGGDARAGKSTRVLFLIPAESAWPGPVYELALMMATWAEWKGVEGRLELRLATAEDRHLEALDPALHDTLARNLRRKGIRAQTGRHPRRVETGSVEFDEGESEPFDVLVNAATYLGAGPSQGLEVDDRGFYRTLLDSRQQPSTENVYAVGDGSDYAVKQGFLALLQADAAAEHIASRVLQEAPVFGFEAGRFWVMEELDQVLVTHGDASDMQFEEMPPGRLRRLEVLGYLPREHRLGNPLYSGLLWKGTEIGLKIIGHLPARSN